MISGDWLAALTVVPLARLIVFLAAVGVAPAMVEMGYLHHRGNFHRWPMFLPVIYPPLFAAAGFILLGTNASWAYWLFAAASGLLLLMGLLGAFFHVQGISRQTGGFNLDNLMVGPPLMAPLSFSFLAVLAFIGLVYWS